MEDHVDGKPFRKIAHKEKISKSKAARYIFPYVLIQTCQNYFLENIRKDLKVRMKEKYRPFVEDLKKELFSKKISAKTLIKRAFKIFKKYEEARKVNCRANYSKQNRTCPTYDEYY